MASLTTDGKTQRVFIVRHGERLDNVDYDWQGKVAWGKDRPYDPPLTEKGKCQATELGQTLKEENIHCVISSPFFRCLQTAQQVADVLLEPSKIGIHNQLCELLHPCCGIRVPPSLPAKNLSSHEIVVDESLGINSKLPTFPENYEMASDRFVQAIHDLADRHWPSNIVLVTHGYAVTETLRWICPRRSVWGAHYCSWLKIARTSKRKDFTFVKSNGIY